MARSALVIGLGGTGQWALTFLKKDLMESNDGVMPADVQLLAVDTQLLDVQLYSTRDYTANDSWMGHMTGTGVGNVRIDPIREFFQLWGPSYDLIKEIHQESPRSEEYKWLDTGYFLDFLGIDQEDWEKIAFFGSNRQLGRLSLFNQVGRFYNGIRQAISAWDQATANRMMLFGDQPYPLRDRLEVVIVTSLAGGTGSGIFLDVAWLVRAAAKSLNVAQYFLTGYLIMPTAWEQQGPSTDKRLRAYAAWQELNRYMLPPMNTQTYEKIKYNANPLIEAEYDRRIFDIAYIIDPGPPAQNLSAMRPEYGTFPVVAQAISALLDDHLGQMISLNCSDLLPLLGFIPPAVYYSSVGAFTFKTPEHFSKQQIVNEYKLAVLEHLIAPNFGPAGQVTGIRKDRNTEATPSTVDYGAQSFLSSDQHNMINNNALLPEIQTVSAKGEDLMMYVIEEGNKVVNRAGGTFKALVTKVNDPDLQRQLDDAINENIWHVVRPSGDRPNATPRGIKQEVLKGVNDRDVEWFGQWGYVPDPNNPSIQMLTRITEGSKVRLLREAADAIVKDYKVLLKEWSAIQLNGIDSDPAKAKSGKLGYLIGVYEELDRKFDAYLSFLARLKDRLSENRTRVKLTDARDLARKRYDMDAGKECIFAFFDNNVHPHAREAERGFLRATNKLFEYYLSEAVIESLSRAVQSIQEFTKKSKNKLDQWEISLAVGKEDGDLNKRFRSVYNYGWSVVQTEMDGFHAEVRRGNPDFEKKHQLTGVQKVLNVGLANNHYQANNRMATFSQRDPIPVPYRVTPEIEAGLEMFVWNVKQTDEDGALQFEMGLRSGNDEIESINSAHTNRATAENYRILSKELGQVFDRHIDNLRIHSTPIVNILAREFQDTNQLAQDLRRLSTPLYQQKQDGQIAYERNSMFMRLDASANNGYFINLEQAIQNQRVNGCDFINHFNNPGNYVTTSDPYKFTFLQLYYHISNKDFALFDQMENLFHTTMAQPNQVISPSTHYVLFAEKTAHQYAMKRSQLQDEPYRTFEPEIVALLNHPERLKLFFLAYAQGLLTFEDGGKDENTVWRLDGNGVMNSVTIFDEMLYDIDSNRNPTVYEILHLWLAGRDVNENASKASPIEWDKLSQYVIDQERGPSQETILALYRKHMDEDDPESLVSLIQRQAENRRQAVMIMRYYQEKMFDDLCDLAKLVYMERLEIIQGEH